MGEDSLEYHIHVFVGGMGALHMGERDVFIKTKRSGAVVGRCEREAFRIMGMRDESDINTRK